MNINDKVCLSLVPPKNILLSIKEYPELFPNPIIRKNDIFLKMKYELGYVLLCRLHDGQYFNASNIMNESFIYLGQLPDIITKK